MHDCIELIKIIDVFFLDSIDKNKGEILDDLQMNTDELQELTRKRRMIQSNDQLQRREKRSLSPFDFYDTNPVNHRKKIHLEENMSFLVIWIICPSHSIIRVRIEIFTFR